MGKVGETQFRGASASVVDVWSCSLKLPWPPTKLSPNALSGKNWAVRWAAAKRFRVACGLVTRQWLSAGGRCPPPGYLSARALFLPPDRRSRDLDGCLGSMKHALDAVAECLRIDDRVFRPWTIDFGEQAPGGAVELRLEALRPVGALDDLG